MKRAFDSSSCYVFLSLYLFQSVNLIVKFPVRYSLYVKMACKLYGMLKSSKERVQTSKIVVSIKNLTNALCYVCMWLTLSILYLQMRWEISTVG